MHEKIGSEDHSTVKIDTYDINVMRASRGMEPLPHSHSDEPSDMPDVTIPLLHPQTETVVFQQEGAPQLPPVSPEERKRLNFRSISRQVEEGKPPLSPKAYVQDIPHDPPTINDPDMITPDDVRAYAAEFPLVNKNVK